MRKETILVLITLGILVLVGCQQVQECPKPKECPVKEEKSMLVVDMDTWGYNDQNPSELLFKYNIKNYGDVESKNVRVECKLQDDNGNIPVFIKHRFGNVASNSVKYGEAITPKTGEYNSNKEYYAFCYIIDCENCEILYKKIPEIKEVYEEFPSSQNN